MLMAGMMASAFGMLLTAFSIAGQPVEARVSSQQLDPNAVGSRGLNLDLRGSASLGERRGRVLF